MIRKLRSADQTGDLNRQFRGYLRTSILIIDEVGYLPLSRSDANLVFQIIARRYEKGSVIITSNKTFRLNGARSSPTRSSPRPSSTGSSTTATSSPSTGPAGA